MAYLCMELMWVCRCQIRYDNDSKCNKSLCLADWNKSKKSQNKILKLFQPRLKFNESKTLEWSMQVGVFN